MSIWCSTKPYLLTRNSLSVRFCSPMATALTSFRLASVRVSSSSSSSSRRSDPNHRKPASVNWWAPLFGWSSDADYVASAGHSSPNLHGSSESELESGRNGPRFPPGCFTEEKAKQLRKKTMESSTFHDIMYHSAIASRLASDASERYEN